MIRWLFQLAKHHHHTTEQGGEHGNQQDSQSPASLTALCFAQDCCCGISVRVLATLLTETGKFYVIIATLLFILHQHE